VWTFEWISADYFFFWSVNQRIYRKFHIEVVFLGVCVFIGTELLALFFENEAALMALTEPIAAPPTDPGNPTNAISNPLDSSFPGIIACPVTLVLFIIVCVCMRSVTNLVGSKDETWNIRPDEIIFGPIQEI
jgi:hypothetical protein